MECKEAKTGVILTDHAYDRLKERNGWGRATAERMAERILAKGTRSEDVKGYLKPYVQKKAFEAEEYAGDAVVVLYGDIIYIFTRKNVLITAYPAPTKNCFIRARQGMRSKSKRRLDPCDTRRNGVRVAV